MTSSRSLLWLALGALTAPLLVQGIGGCGFSNTLDPIADNAYTCNCRCNAGGPRPTSVAIAASSDDAEQNGSAMLVDGVDLDLGTALVGVRFADLGIPPGATINSATVQFTAQEASGGTANLAISAELSTAAATFTMADDDLSGRTFTLGSVSWSPGPWTAGAAGDQQRTSDLKTLLQAVVNQSGWSTASALVLRIQGPAGSANRAAVSFDTAPARAAVLQVVYTPGVQAALPICATPEIAGDLDALNRIPQGAAIADCAGRVATTLEGLAGACGYPSDCSCELVIPEDGDASFDRDVCGNACTETLVDATCSNFNPNGFAACVQGPSGSEAACASHVAATNATGGDPVCLAAAGAGTMAARLFGQRSACEVAGTSHIQVGDREPTRDPATRGTVEILGEPCPGGGCAIAASFGLTMDPITFSVKFHSDPTFRDLSVSGDSLAPTTIDGVNATFAEDTVGGTGNGRRLFTGSAIDASNQRPLILGVDWPAKLCDLTGNLAATVDGEGGLCTGDGTTECTADSPDCDEVGGPCNFDGEDTQDFLVDVALAGSLENQPPAAAAGADQTIECTSTAGASFTLDGTATDPDQNLAQTTWRTGGRLGAVIAESLSVGQSLGVGATRSYVLRVLDSFAQGDEDETQVAVRDTTAPDLTLGVSPTALPVPNHKLVLVTATLATSDICDANPVIRLLSIVSNEPDNGLGDGDKPNDIQGAAFGTDDRQFLLRSERGGLGTGRIYTITYTATDASGNVATRTATVSIE